MHEPHSSTAQQPLTGTFDVCVKLADLEPYFGTDWLIRGGHPHQLRGAGWVYIRVGGRVAARVRAVRTEQWESRPERTGGETATDRGPGRVLIVDPATWEHTNYRIPKIKGLGRDLWYLETLDDQSLQFHNTSQGTTVGRPLLAGDGYLGIEIPPPELSAPKSSASPGRQTGKRDHVQQASENQQIGDEGEQFVLQLERRMLEEHGRQDLAEQIEHVAKTNDGAGYDIRSFDPHNDEERLIEVKTTRRDENERFHITRHELEFSAANADRYELIRVFNLRDDATAGFYRLSGDMNECLGLRAEQFTAWPQSAQPVSTRPPLRQ